MYREGSTCMSQHSGSCDRDENVCATWRTRTSTSATLSFGVPSLPLGGRQSAQKHALKIRFKTSSISGFSHVKCQKGPVAIPGEKPSPCTTCCVAAAIDMPSRSPRPLQSDSAVLETHIFANAARATATPGLCK